MIGLHEVVAPPPYVMVDGNFLTVDGHPVVAGSREYAYSGYDCSRWLVSRVETTVEL